MPPVARRFRYQAAGELIVGLSFHSEAELDAWLSTYGAGGTVVILYESASAPVATGEPRDVRPVGRPSKDPAIDAAIDALASQALDPSTGTLAARARRVQDHMRALAGPDEVPSTVTISRRIADRSRLAAQNSDQN